MHEERPLDGANDRLRQLESEYLRLLVDAQDHVLVQPVHRHQVDIEHQIQQREPTRESQGDEDRCQYVRQAELNVELAAHVDLFVLALDDLNGLLAIAAVLSILASPAESLELADEDKEVRDEDHCNLGGHDHAADLSVPPDIKIFEYSFHEFEISCEKSRGDIGWEWQRVEGQQDDDDRVDILKHKYVSHAILEVVHLVLGLSLLAEY